MTGLEVFSLNGHTDWVFSAQFSANGKHIVTSSRDKTVRVWDAKTGKGIGSLNGHTNEVYYAEFNPNGNRIVTASKDNTAKVWDAKTGAELFSFKADRIFSLSSAPTTGIRIVTSSDDRCGAEVLDAITGKKLSFFKRYGEIWGAAFSADGNCIITGHSDGNAVIWDATTGKELILLKLQTKAIHFLNLSPDGNRIVTASADNTVKLWDATTGAELLSLKGHTSWVRFAQFSHDGKRIVTASDDGTVIIWDSRPYAESFAEREAAEAERKTTE